jgi:hypothetical protein
MANGHLLDEVRKILDQDIEIPSKVTNRLVMAGLIDVKTMFTEHYMKVNTNVKELSERVTRLEDCIDNIKRTDELKHERFVSWPFLLRNVFLPVITAVVTAALIALFVMGYTP